MNASVRHFLSYTVRWTCPIFTVVFLLFSAVSFYQGAESLRLMTLITILAESVVAAALCFIAFTDRIVHHAGTAKRYLLLYTMLVPEVMLAGFLFGWFDSISAVLWTFVILAGCFLFISLPLILAERRAERTYSEKLEAYKKHSENKRSSESTAATGSIERPASDGTNPPAEQKTVRHGSHS